jgi:Na+-transporting methylmalonyl-CoA/oxaloacetate decarboxylase gamma subunit
MTTIHDQLTGVGGAFTISLIAFSVVFLVLGGLSAVIYGIKYMASGLEKKKVEPPKSGGGAPASSAPAPSAPASGNGPLLAVLAAAVAAAGERGRITGVSLAGGVGARPAPVGMWKSAGIMEGVRTLGRGWKQ